MTESAWPAPTVKVVPPIVAVKEPETHAIVVVGPVAVNEVAMSPMVPRTAICEVGVLKR
jgi:hypothetical protein